MIAGLSLFVGWVLEPAPSGRSRVGEGTMATDHDGTIPKIAADGTVYLGRATAMAPIFPR